MTEPHSQAYFGDERESWWHADSLALLGARFQLHEVRSLLDVGCGVGHWSRAMFQRIAPDARLTAIDFEMAHLGPARTRFTRAFPEHASQAAHARTDAHVLPFRDASFDAVTCQTVLIHLKNPARAIAEFTRVLKPGGLVLVAEPNNFFSHLDWNAATLDGPHAELVAIFDFWLRWHRGKIARGFGDNTLGEKLPALFSAAGLEQIRVYQNDRAQPFFPPYAEPHQQALLRAAERWKDEGVGPWDEAELRANFLAGGGAESEFAPARAHLEAHWARNRERVRARNFAAAGGAFFYVVGARKPR